MEPSSEPTILDTVLPGLTKCNSATELRHFVNATYMQLNLSGKGRRKLLAAIKQRESELPVETSIPMDEIPWQRKPKRPRSKKRQIIQPGRTASVVRGAFPKPTRKRHPVHTNEVTDPRFLSRTERERRNAKVSSS